MSSGGGGGRRVHEEEHEEHENHERWLVSFADMMTVLMALFIVLYAISSVNLSKFEELKSGKPSNTGNSSLEGGESLLKDGEGVAPDPAAMIVTFEELAGRNPENTPKINAERVAALVKETERAKIVGEVDALKEAERELKAALRKAGLERAVTFRFDERGLVATVATDEVLFASGGADLASQGKRILDVVAPTLKALPNRISVEGHTNHLPISTAQFPSNWELSSARATGVLRYLTGRHDMPVDRLSATGFADTQPLLPRSDPKNLTVNRRVEIIVLATVDNAAGRAVAELAAE